MSSGSAARMDAKGGQGPRGMGDDKHEENVLRNMTILARGVRRMVELDDGDDGVMIAGSLNRKSCPKTRES